MPPAWNGLPQNEPQGLLPRQADLLCARAPHGISGLPLSSGAGVQVAVHELQELVGTRVLLWRDYLAETAIQRSHAMFPPYPDLPPLLAVPPYLISAGCA